MDGVGSGNIKDLNEGGTEAMQALLSSLFMEDSSRDVNNKMTAEQVRKISEKLQEIIPEGDKEGSLQTRNEKGQLVNEEGLPIIEISEPVTNVILSQPEAVRHETDVIPLSSLPPSERERRRLQREHVLDLLEQEERDQEAKREAQESQEFRDSLQRRKQEAKMEIESLQTAREMQKKMGRALVQSMGDVREQEEKSQKDNVAKDAVTDKRRPLKADKSVSFADELPADSTKIGKDLGADEKEAVLGDVQLARLRPGRVGALGTKAQLERQPMKLAVVERRPVVATQADEADVRDDRDSDDESIPESLVPADSEDGKPISTDTDDDQRHEEDLDHSFVPDGSSEDDEDESEQEPELEEEFDLDTARHQREIALQYYAKRASIGTDVAKAMTTHGQDEDEWDQPEVPLEATLANPAPKPSVSRFKANRLAAAYGSPYTSSTSLGSSGVLPAEAFHKVQRAIRTGKLEDDQLVGNSASEGEEDEEVKQVIELLKKGEMHNVGPQLPEEAQPPQNSLPASHSPTSPTLSVSQLTPTVNPSSLRPPAVASLKVKTSKFKVARLQSENASSRASSPHSLTATPISNAERSSPKIPPASPDIDSEQSTVVNSAITPGPTGNSVPPWQSIPMVIESPSFAAPPARLDATRTGLGIRQFGEQRTVSFIPGSPTVQAEVQERRPQRPPTIMSSARQSIDSTPGSSDGARTPQKKLSKFRAERM